MSTCETCRWWDDEEVLADDPSKHACWKHPQYTPKDYSCQLYEPSRAFIIDCWLESDLPLVTLAVERGLARE